MTSIVDWVDSLNYLTMREWVNAIWFAVSFTMCLEFGRVLLKRIFLSGRSWRKDVGTRAALALFGYFLGESIIRVWTWLLLAHQNAGDPMVNYFREEYAVVFLAAGISTWAALCCIYVFSATHWSWLRATLTILLIIAICAVIV